VQKEGEISVLFELTQDLLTKVEGCMGSELSGEVFRVLLILLSHLSHTAATAVAEDNESLITTLYSAPLQSILRSMVGTIQNTPGSMQRARAHLYGSLLYYLSLARQHPSETKRRRGQSLWQLERNDDSLSASNLATITSFGEPLMETVCRDASSGHDVTRMLSLSLLDAVFSMDYQGSWLRFMVARGYLAKLCASLLWEDEGLQKMLHPHPEALRALYVHESKMALLTRLAQTPAGSRELLAANCIGYLAQCHFIDLRPDHHGDQLLPGNLIDPSGGGFVPAVGDRYRQLLVPLLKLLLTMLTCPGAQRSEVKSQVTSLIGAHTDTFTSILKNHRGSVSMAALEELSLVTGVIGHSGVGQDWSSQDSTAVGAGMMHIQRLMLGLIPHYWDRQVWSGVVSEAVRGEGTPDPLVTMETQLRLLQICANIISYCRTAMTMGGTEYSSPYCHILFSPDLTASLATNQNKDAPHSFPSSHLTPSQAQSLGRLIRHLREVCEEYSTALDSSQQLQRKLSHTTSLTQDEILQLISISGSSLPLSHQQSLAHRKLQQMLSATQNQMQLLAYIAENLLYVLWRHLQFYLVHCKPVGGARELGVGGASFGRPSIRKLGEQAKVTAMETTFDLSSLSDGVSAGDMEQLRGTVGRCLPSSLFKQLLDIEEDQLKTKSEVRVGFIQALVHRIRKLIKLRATAPPFTI
jgi:nuclear pore complex protein Nup205